MTATKDWFKVDKGGLAKLLEMRGKEFAIYELLQNAWDTKCPTVTMSLKPVAGQPYADLWVWDDHPEGWKNLDHAYTLFAESDKKADPEKRGRFNLGEKLVLALCKEARIETTTGTVVFGPGGRRHLKACRKEGSSFEARIRMTREEYDQVVLAVRRLICPQGVETRFNGVLVGQCRPAKTISCTLPTEIADGDGIMRRVMRQTKVEVIEVLPGDQARLYEMNIPVVELPGGERYHVNVLQKVPLNSDRDNVTASYLQELRTLVLNSVYADLEPEDASAPWVRDGLSDEKITKDAAERIMTLRFSEKRVIADMNDPEGTKRAVSEGYTVIQPGSLSGGEWESVRRHSLALPAGKVTPTPRPFSPDGKPLRLIPKEEWTPGMTRFAAYAEDLAHELMGRKLDVRFTADRGWNFRAAYGAGVLTVSTVKLGRDWFDGGPSKETDELLIHEFGHEYSGDHLSHLYHAALCRLGASLASLAISDPSFFKRHLRVF